MSFVEPPYNCDKCPRLARYLSELRIKLHDGHNGPVKAFGDIDAGFLIVGLAPGAKGANYTGRPFTGDGAGDYLYPELLRTKFATGAFQGHVHDGLKLQNCRITNAVRCVPPENKPLGIEIRNCNAYLKQEIATMSHLKVILSLGRISHEAILRVFGYKMKEYAFAHGAQHQLNLKSITGKDKDIMMINSYHCSRYNMNTKRLTPEMFMHVFDACKDVFEKLSQE